MKMSTTMAAGIIGALVMTGIMWVARNILGMPVNLEMMLGTMIGMEPSVWAWFIGFVIHLTAGAVFALLYAEGFEHLTHRASWLVGLIFGAVHTVFSGFFLGLIPALHPLIPEQMAAPGLFMSATGVIGVIAFAALHLIYGAIVGGMYGPVLHPVRHAGHGEPRHAH